MTKNLTLLILSLLCFKVAEAQKTTDTVLCYMKNSGKLTANKDSADYFMFIMPMDSTTKLSAVNEYYPNGKPKLFGNSINRKYNQLSFDGSCITYYANGHKKSIMNYNKGYIWGEIILYYPNGNLYTITKFNGKGQDSLVECRDSSGRVLAENGNGKWLKFYSDFSSEFEEGPIKDSLKEGEWHEMTSGHENYVVIYHKGIVVSTTDPNRIIGEPVFAAVEHEPEYPDGGAAGFNMFLAHSIKIPGNLMGNASGKVVVTFVVEKDGTLTNLRTIRSPNVEMSKAMEQAILMSPPWTPGMQNGEPVRVQFTVSFNFTEQ